MPTNLYIPITYIPKYLHTYLFASFNNISSDLLSQKNIQYICIPVVIVNTCLQFDTSRFLLHLPQPLACRRPVVVAKYPF